MNAPFTPLRSVPVPHKQRTLAELRAEAEALFTDEVVARKNKGLHPAFGHSTRKSLIDAYIAIKLTPAMRAELDAKRRAEFGPLWKDVHPRGAL